MKPDPLQHPGYYLPSVSFGAEAKSWAFTLADLVHYGFHRLRWVRCPDLHKHTEHVLNVTGRVMHYSRRLRIRGAEHCPKQPPAVFAGNHLLTGDPFLMFPAIVHASGRGVLPRIRRRDDFFAGLPGWISKIVDLDEILVSLNVTQISRGSVTFAQLKPFLNLLREPGAFLIYPGRTRSRTGTFFEYRDGMEEPGSVAFFLAHAQAGRPELRVAAVPMARSYNPVNKHSAVVFGPPRYLGQETGVAAQRAAQRAFDADLIVAMGDLVEVNAAQLVAAMLCLRGIRQRPAEVSGKRLSEQVAVIVQQLQGRRLLNPALEEDPARETASALAYFETIGALIRKTDSVEVKPVDTRSPGPDNTYKHRLPLRFLANQIYHLRDVIAMADEAARE